MNRSLRPHTLPVPPVFALVFVLAATLIFGGAHAQDKAMAEIRYVIIHRPGPAWKPGVPAFEQPGLQDHVKHFAKWLQEGKLLMGGPFMDPASGGSMIAEVGVTESEARAFAAEDPTVRAGLLVFEVRPWLAALHK